MANISIYHDSVLDGAHVTATGTLVGSSATYLKDNRLSFPYQSTSNQDTVDINQPVASGSPGLKAYEYLVISDHDLGTDQVTISGLAWEDTNRDTGTVIVIDQVVPNTDPAIVPLLGLVPRVGDGSIQLNITRDTTSATLNMGELQLVSKFTSPQSPGIGITTEYMPHRTSNSLPNGERQSVKHGEVTRKKTYTIGGLSLSEAAEWVDVYQTNDGSKMVMLEDDVGDTYPCLMSTSLTINDEVKIVTLSIEFQEVKV
jgi:hypothetical protein